ncbi:MAG: trans-aconitate 2-methyltransferase [Methanomassiliicoccales archaeon PtaU1.Bin124]|nr:MAG: trans-aconitate 2-methyltransferase [Methanomassiliicoccales archaeon PtaU1.Bin124]
MSEQGKRMSSIRQNFSNRSEEYDDEIVRFMKDYHAMLDAAIDSLPMPMGSSPSVVDLGTGTGNLSACLLQKYPKARLLCVDMTREMLDKARRRFASYEDVSFLEKDFYELEMPDGQDAVIASLSLHHIVTDDDKRDFYANIWNALKPGGVFVNADAVLSADEWVDALYKRRWREYMATSMDQAGVEEVMDRHKREDSLPVLTDQLGWLKEVGFSKVDVIWKNYMAAVVWARR